MAAVASLFRAELRARWRAWATLAFIVGILGGSVMAVVAGARRTDSALPRFLTATRAPDVLSFNTDDPGSVIATVSFDDISALPQVVESGRLELPQVVRPLAVELIVPVDDSIGRSFFFKKVLAGRLPDPSSATEVAISFTLADAYSLHVGDLLELDVRRANSTGTPSTEHVSLSIVGIEASATEFPPQTGEGTLGAWATPAFLTAHPGLALFHSLAVRLRGGTADFASYQSELTKMAAGNPLETFALADQSVNTQRSIHLQAVTLWILAALLAGVGALVVTQLLSRQGQLEATEYSSLRAIGVTSMQLWWLGLLRAVSTATAGTAIACAIAVGVSPLFPVGLAGVAEPHPGPLLDGRVLALGGLGTVVVVVLLAAWPSYQVARRRGSRSFSLPDDRPSIVTAGLVAAGAPPTVTTGVRFALERGRRSTAVPVRSSIAISSLAVLVVAGAMVFTANLDHLLARPDRYGVLWDAEVITVGSSTEGVSPASDAALRDPHVDSVSEGYAGVPLAIGDVRVDGIALDDRRGPALMATALEGRVPTGPGEVIVGTQTLRQLHAKIGDRIAIQIAGTPAMPSYTIVGRASFPSLADGLGLGRGVGFTLAGLKSTIPDQLAPPADTVLIRFRDDANSTAGYDQLDKEVSAACACQLVRPIQPVDLVNFGRVQYFPVMLGALMGALGVLVLAHLLISATRRRRRELAMMLVLGFVPAQVRRVVAWQATTVAVASALIGLPLGVIGGRFAWTQLADQLGVSAQPLIPVMLVVVPVGAIVVANAVALIPARSAVSHHLSRVLREP